ncbi:MAG: DUF4852 domain-containing protein [Cyclobacteriaceae bacterium]
MEFLDNFDLLDERNLVFHQKFYSMKIHYSLLLLCLWLLQSCNSSQASSGDESKTSEKENLIATSQEDLFFYFIKFKQENDLKQIGLTVGTSDNLADEYLRKFKMMDYATANDFAKKKMQTEAQSYIDQKLASIDLSKPITLKASFCSFDRYDFDKSAFHVQSGSINRGSFQFPNGAIGGNIPVNEYQEFVSIEPSKAEKILGLASSKSVNQWLIARAIKGDNGKAYLEIEKAIYTDSQTNKVVIE